MIRREFLFKTVLGTAWASICAAIGLKPADPPDQRCPRGDDGRHRPYMVVIEQCRHRGLHIQFDCVHCDNFTTRNWLRYVDGKPFWGPTLPPLPPQVMWDLIRSTPTATVLAKRS